LAESGGVCDHGSTTSKNKTSISVLSSGVRSGKAAEWLRSNGFTEVVELEGGIKAWLDADRRVVK